MPSLKAAVGRARIAPAKDGAGRAKSGPAPAPRAARAKSAAAPSADEAAAKPAAEPTPRRPMPMRLASVDVGTNSIHTIIVDVQEDGTFQIIDRFKEMVRLGEEVTESHGLTARAIGDGLQALARTKQLCDSHKVEKILAVATSAVRESANGAEFLNLVRRQTGMRIAIITGHEESRLIHLAAARAIDFGRRRALICDIGGGSAELIVGTQTDSLYADSAKCGVLRLRDSVPLSDPPTPREIERVRQHARDMLGRVLEEVRSVGFDFMIGTSGTILSLVQLAVAREKSAPRLQNAVVTRRRLAEVRERLCSMTMRQREALSGLSARRADTIIPGSVLVETIMAELGVQELTACTWALREGVIIDYIDRHLPHLRTSMLQTDPRRRSVMALCHRCQWHEKHSRQVTALALALFDHLRPMHALEDGARLLLEFACYLHDIGYIINADDHHKHGRYLILHAGLTGFEPQEVQVLAALARYHRGRMPRKKDEEIEGLSPKHRRLVEVLGGILRVADGLDRTHHSLVHRVDVTMDSSNVDVIVHAHGDAELELWYARKKGDLLAEALARNVRIRLATAALVPAHG